MAKVVAIRNLGKIEDMHKKRCFTVLKQAYKIEKNQRKLEQSDMVADKIVKLQTALKDVESGYKGLFKENEILRAASLEGLDITIVKIVCVLKINKGFLGHTGIK